MNLTNYLQPTLIEFMNNLVDYNLYHVFNNTQIKDKNKFKQLLGDKAIYVDYTTVGIVRGQKVDKVDYMMFFRLLNRAIKRGIVIKCPNLELLLQAIRMNSIKDYVIEEDFKNICRIYNTLNVKTCLSEATESELEMIDKIGFKLFYIDNPLIKYRMLLLDIDGVTYASIPYSPNEKESDDIFDDLCEQLGYVDLIEYTGYFYIDAPDKICYIDLLDQYYDKANNTIRLSVVDDCRDYELELLWLDNDGYVVTLDEAIAQAEAIDDDSDDTRDAIDVYGTSIISVNSTYLEQGI